MTFVFFFLLVRNITINYIDFLDKSRIAEKMGTQINKSLPCVNGRKFASKFARLAVTEGL